MHRYELRNDKWERIKDFLPGRKGHVGGTSWARECVAVIEKFRYELWPRRSPSRQLALVTCSCVPPRWPPIRRPRATVCRPVRLRRLIQLGFQLC